MAKSWEQLLGGYATDTLTEEEKRQLYEAALHDQVLFDTLADEEALKDLLANPEARQRILESLQISEVSKESATTSPHRWSWFRKSSSLAWAGSIAAMGLALIFGWQMNKDWGPVVQQEQEAARSGSNGKDQVVLQSQAPATTQMKEEEQDIPKKDQSQPERVAGLPPSLRSPQPSTATIAKASKDFEDRGLSSAPVRNERGRRQAVEKEGRLKPKESVMHPPESAIVQNIPEEEPMVAPSASSSEAFEQAPQQLARPPAFADKLEEGKALSSPGAKDLFYANKGGRIDDVGEEIDGMRGQQLLGGMSSKAEKALTEDVSNLKDPKEVVGDHSQGITRGIRYSFVRPDVDGQDEAIDITKFSGKWSELQLALESNVSGHLYVLTSFGKGKWQSMRPESSNVPRSSDGAIQMNPYQPVNFALSQVTNTLGKPVVSSITALLSSTPLTDLGKWLDENVDMSRLQVEGIDGAMFVVERNQKSGEIINVQISLKN